MGDFIEFLREGTGPAGNAFIAYAAKRKGQGSGETTRP
jgi:hypothetical protein